MTDQDFEAFAYTVSHDLREPVRMVRSFMELLQKKYGDQLDEKARNYVHFALDGSQRLDQMIQDLLTFYRCVNEGPKTEFDLSQLFREVSSELLLQDPRIKFEHTTYHVTSINADINAWRQLLGYLFTDMLIFLPEHDEKLVKIELFTDGIRINLNMLLMNIQADEHSLEQSFRLFNRAGMEQKEGAYRIGWSVVKRMLEHWGGKFECQLLEGRQLKISIQAPL